MTGPPYHPIVYVRGYAGTQAEVEDTAATPYMGFNLGSTKVRQTWTGTVVRHIFESPLVRLMKDHGYTDVYEEGTEITGREPPPRSVWIYRYYEPVSADLGTGRRPEMEDYARGLDAFIERMRDQLCGPAGSHDATVEQARQEFGVYLVAHSMGGLVVRCYLQKIKRGQPHPVRKAFTYATPHGGIDFRLVGNIPAFVRVNNTENFSEERMREYLEISGPNTPVSSLDGTFDPDRFFCFVGTNHRDYEAALGLSSAAVGPMSDGLVQIKNASVEGAPRAFAHRAHSGHYGIVNSEEGYQNLVRFLFGDVRVDGLLEVDDITLPPKVARARREGKAIRASYHIETIVRVRGKRWDLHRRTVDEESAIFRTYDEMVKRNRPAYLFSAFLARDARVNKQRATLGFSIDLRVLVPEYVVDGLLFLDEHHEGGYLYREKINLQVAPAPNGVSPRLRYGFDSRTPNRTSQALEGAAQADGHVEYRIPVARNTRPGLSGTLVLRARGA